MKLKQKETETKKETEKKNKKSRNTKRNRNKKQKKQKHKKSIKTTIIKRGKMGLKKHLAYTALFIGCSALGFARGRSLGTDRDYQLQRNHEEVLLIVKDTDTCYELTRLNDQVYLGNAEHNLNGSLELGRYQFFGGEPKIEQNYSPPDFFDIAKEYITNLL